MPQRLRPPDEPDGGCLLQRIAALEGGVAAVAVASGAAAVTYTLEALVHHGQHIVAATTIYGGTYNLFEHTFPNYGIETTFVDPTKGVEVFEEAIKENTRAVYIESVGNPECNLIDIQAVADIAHKHKIPLVVDSTFATPYQLRPFEYAPTSSSTRPRSSSAAMARRSAVSSSMAASSTGLLRASSHSSLTRTRATTASALPRMSAQRPSLRTSAR